YTGNDLLDCIEEVPVVSEPILEQQRRRRRSFEPLELYGDEKNVVTLSVSFRTLYRLVPLRPEILQGQRAVEKLRYDVPLRHKNVQKVSFICILCRAKTTMPLGRMTNVMNDFLQTVLP
ncbi:hypothetical protein BDFB_012494, partial [Asbolus verrucosus]